MKIGQFCSPDRIVITAAVTLCVSVIFAIGLTADQGSQRGRATGSPTSLASGAYTADQAIAGKANNTEQCAACHRGDLMGDGAGGCVPALSGQEFFANWRNQTLEDLFALVRDTMPRGAPNNMPAADYVNIIAYMLKENGFPAGTTELTGQPQALRLIRIAR